MILHEIESQRLFQINMDMVYPIKRQASVAVFINFALYFSLWI